MTVLPAFATLHVKVSPTIQHMLTDEAGAPMQPIESRLPGNAG